MNCLSISSTTRLPNGSAKAMSWYSKWVRHFFDQAFDTLLHAVDIVENRLMEFEELRQTIGKDFMFYLQINLRKLKEDHESESCRSKLICSNQIISRHVLDHKKPGHRSYIAPGLLHLLEAEKVYDSFVFDLGGLYEACEGFEDHVSIP